MAEKSYTIKKLTDFVILFRDFAKEMKFDYSLLFRYNPGKDGKITLVISDVVFVRFDPGHPDFDDACYHIFLTDPDKEEIKDDPHGFLDDEYDMPDCVAHCIRNLFAIKADQLASKKIEEFAEKRRKNRK